MRVLGCLHGQGRGSGARALMDCAAAAAPTARRIGAEGSPLCVLVDEARPDIGWAEAPDGSLVVVDGEVYELPGGLQPESSMAAARIILDLFARRGPSIFAEINSGAAIALWDAGPRRLHLGVDRGGLGQCYVMEGKDALFWASDILTLVELDDRALLDPAAVDLMLAGGFVPMPWTILSHVRKLPPSHRLEADARATKMDRYWFPDPGPKRELPQEEAREELDRLLLQAVRRRLPKPRKIAMLLSGGIDSSLLLAYLTRRCGIDAEAYTFRYENYEGVFNEGDRARRVAEACGAPHHEILYRPSDLADQLERILIDHQGPISVGVHTAMVGPIAAAGAEALFGGHGADSYFYSSSERIGLFLSGRPRAATGALRLSAAGLRPFYPRLAYNMGYAAFVAQTGLTWRFMSPITSESQRAALYLRDEMLARAKAALAALCEPLVARFAEFPVSDRIPLVTQQFSTATHWTQSFARGSGMAARCPYMDNDLMEFLYSQPRPPEKKSELRALAAGLLGPDIAAVPKLGQTLPMRDWLRGPLARFLHDRLTPESIAPLGLFREEAVRRLMERHISGAGDHHWTLWVLLGLVEFQKIVRGRAGRLARMAEGRTAAPSGATLIRRSTQLV